MTDCTSLRKDSNVFVFKPDHRTGGKTGWLSEAKVSSVGRLYLEVEIHKGQPIKFHREDGREKGEVGYQKRLYLSAEDYQREIDFEKACNRLFKLTRHYSFPKNIPANLTPERINEIATELGADLAT